MRFEPHEYGFLDHDVAGPLRSAKGFTDLIRLRTRSNPLPASLEENLRKTEEAIKEIFVVHNEVHPLAMAALEAYEKGKIVEYDSEKWDAQMQQLHERSRQALASVTALNEAIRRLKQQDQLGLTPEASNDLEKYMESLTGGIEKYHRFTSSSLNSNPHSFSIQDLVHEYQQNKTIAITADLPEEPIRIYGDRIRLYRILDNLGRNAHRHGRQEQAHIQVRRKEGRVILRFSDQGPGIAPEIRGRLFQLGASTRKNGEGHGRGLKFSKDTAEKHGGTLDVEKTSPKGTTFALTLPVDTFGRKVRRTVGQWVARIRQRLRLAR